MSLRPFHVESLVPHKKSVCCGFFVIGLSVSKENIEALLHIIDSSIKLLVSSSITQNRANRVIFSYQCAVVSSLLVFQYPRKISNHCCTVLIHQAHSSSVVLSPKIGLIELFSHSPCIKTILTVAYSHLPTDCCCKSIHCAFYHSSC